METVLTPRKTELGWIVDVPREMADALKIAPGSLLLLYPKEGAVELEILPPPDAELLTDFERMYERYQDVCGALERLGD
jgi:hypothetical protein